MSSFTKPLDIRKLEKGKFLLLETFEYHVGSEESSEVIVVEKGSISDGATIPRFLWSIIGHPMDDYAQAAFVHDKLYTEKFYSRKRCDQIFLEGMAVLKVVLWKRRIMYRALRIFGWWAWGRKKNGNKR